MERDRNLRTWPEPVAKRISTSYNRETSEVISYNMDTSEVIKNAKHWACNRKETI